MEEKDLEFIYQTVKEKVDLLFQDVEHVDNKAGILIGFNGVIFSLALNLYGKACILSLFTVSMLSFLVALFLSLMSLGVREYRRDPNPGALIKGYWNKSREEIMRQLIVNLRECYEVNERIMSRTARWINWSMSLTFLGLVLLWLSVFINPLFQLLLKLYTVIITAK